MDQNPETAEPTFPNPPRWRWTKRLSIAFTLAVLIFLVLVLWWRREAHRRLNAEVVSIRNRGEPLLSEDFAVRPVVDDDNAAILLKAAAANFAASDIALFDYTLRRSATADSAKENQLANLVRASTKRRQLVRSARSRRGFNWDVSMSQSVPGLIDQRYLSTLLSQVAKLEHNEGRDGEAIEVVRDMRNHADRMAQLAPRLTTHLVALICWQYTCETITNLAENLNIAMETSSATQTTGPASRQQIEALIAELLDDEALTTGIVNAMYGQRAVDYEVFRSLQNTSPASLTMPMFELDTLRAMRRDGALAAALRHGNYPAIKKTVDPFNLPIEDYTAVTNATRLLSTVSMPKQDERFVNHW